MSTTSRSRAVPENPLPTATPMRLAPTSNPSAVAMVTIRSGASGIAGEPGQIHAEFRGGRLPALLQRRFEHHHRVSRHGQPSIVGEFLFELAGVPTRIAEHHQESPRAV